MGLGVGVGVFGDGSPLRGTLARGGRILFRNPRYPPMIRVFSPEIDCAIGLIQAYDDDD